MPGSNFVGWNKKTLEYFEKLSRQNRFTPQWQCFQVQEKLKWTILYLQCLSHTIGLTWTQWLRRRDETDKSNSRDRVGAFFLEKLYYGKQMFVFITLLVIFIIGLCVVFWFSFQGIDIINDRYPFMLCTRSTQFCVAQVM